MYFQFFYRQNNQSLFTVFMWVFISVTYSQKLSPYSTERVSLQQQHLQVGQQAQTCWKTVKDTITLWLQVDIFIKSLNANGKKNSLQGKCHLRANVIVCEIKPGQSVQQSHLFRNVSDLVVSQF